MKNAMIKNSGTLARTALRKKALTILEAGYRSLITEDLVGNAVTINEHGVLMVNNFRLPLQNFEHIYLVAIGKSAYHAGKKLAQILGKRLTRGYVLDVQGTSFGRVTVLRGTHPLPSSTNIRAGKKITRLLEGATESDLVLCVISGGSSALLSQPATMTVAEEIVLTKKLLHIGATIDQMNIIRKHLSTLRGGNIAKLAYPAQMVSLIFSDVCGDDLSTIGSAPTLRDTSTISNALAIARRYHLSEVKFLETPKDEKYFRNVTNTLVGSSQVALSAMMSQAKLLGFKPRLLTRTLQGEARLVGQKLARMCKKGEALIAGGETTVVVKGNGKGGRNQELVLGALSSLGSDQVIASIASDGHDNTNAAGAIADQSTQRCARTIKLDPLLYLNNNNAYNFFKKTHDLIFSTAAATNVSDLMLVLKE